MRAADVARRFEDSFRDRVKRVGTLAHAGEVIGHSAAYYSGLMTPGGAGLSLAESLLSLERMGDPMPEEVLHTAIGQLDADPALILLAAREHQKKIGPDLFFREARPRIEALVGAGPTAEGDWSSRAKKIAKLDKLRRRDRQAAKLKLQELISNALDRLEATGLRPRQAFADLAAALGVLAALQRLAGRRDDAMDLLLVARPLSLLANDRVAEGEWFVKTAYLLVDLSRDTRAYQFLLEANSRFFLAVMPNKQGATQVDLGYVLTNSGRHAASRRILEQVLPLLPESDAENRLSAHQLLAANLQALGDLEGALKHVAAAIQLVGDDLLARASCLWVRARLLVELKAFRQALGSYREALALHARFAGAGELAEMAMEYAKLLIQEGRRPELRALAADLSGWILELRGNRKLRDTIDDFTSLIELNELTETALGQIQERFTATKRGIGCGSVKPQPFGG